eukprot:2547303-Pyramimonas_sp.AAC.1
MWTDPARGGRHLAVEVAVEVVLQLVGVGQRLLPRLHRHLRPGPRRPPRGNRGGADAREGAAALRAPIGHLGENGGCQGLHCGC